MRKKWHKHPSAKITTKYRNAKDAMADIIVVIGDMYKLAILMVFA